MDHGREWRSGGRARSGGALSGCRRFLKSTRKAWFGSAVFFNGEYNENYGAYWPISVVLVILAQIIFFVVWITSEDESTWSGDVAGPDVMAWRLWRVFCVGSGSTTEIEFEDIRDEAWWRIWSYWLLHDGATHLLSNVVVQAYLAIPLAMVHGFWVSVIMFVSSIGGALGSGFLNPVQGVVGSSGMSYGLIGAHVANVALNLDSMDMCTFFVRIVVLAICGFIEYVPVFANDGKFKEGISHSTHLGGFVSGLFFALFVLRNLSLEDFHVPMPGICCSRRENLFWAPFRNFFLGDGTPGERWLGRIGILLASAWIVFGVAWIATHDDPEVPFGGEDGLNAFWQPFDPTPEDNC